MILVNFGKQKSFTSTKTPIQLGGNLILSGPVGEFGTLSQYAIQLAIEEINQSGGISGRPLRLISEDNQYDPKQAVSAHQALKLKGIRYFFIDGSPAASVVVKLIGEAGDFSINWGSVAPAYTDGRVNTCRIATTAKTFARAFIQILQKLNVKGLAFLVVNNDYGKGMESEISRLFEASGGTVVAREYFEGKDADFRTQITKLKAKSNRIDVLIIINSGNTIEALLKSLKEMEWNKQIISDLWTIRNPQLKNRALADGIIFADYEYTVEDNPSESARTKAFKEKFRSRFGKEPVYLAAGAYDATYLVAEALKAVGDNDPKRVAEYIANLKNWEGITGTLNFDSDCEVSRKVVFRKVKDSSIVPFE